MNGIIRLASYPKSALDEKGKFVYTFAAQNPDF
jgi:hypothetical protein